MSTPTSEKTPAAAATAHEGSDLICNRDEARMTDTTAPVPPVGTIRLEDRGQSTGITFATMNGDHLLQDDHVRVIVAREDLVAAVANGGMTFLVSDEDVTEHDRRAIAVREAREQKRREAEVLAAARAADIKDAQDLLERLDLDSLISEGANT